MSWEIVVGIGTLVSFVFGAIKFLTPLTDALTRMGIRLEKLEEKIQSIEKELLLLQKAP